MRMWREESGFTPSVLVGLTAGIHLRFCRMGINPYRFCWLSVGEGGVFLGGDKTDGNVSKNSGCLLRGRNWSNFWVQKSRSCVEVGPLMISWSDPVSSCHLTSVQCKLPAASLKASPETTRKNTAFFRLFWALGRFHQDGEILDGHLNTVTHVVESQPSLAGFDVLGGTLPCPKFSSYIARGHHPSF